MIQPEDGKPGRIDFQYVTEESGKVSISMEGSEVLTVTLDADSLSKGLFEELKKVGRFAAFTEDKRREMRDYARARVSERGANFDEDMIDLLVELSVRDLELDFIKRSIEVAKKDISDKFADLVFAFWEKLINIATFTGANALRDLLDIPEQKYDSKVIETSLAKLERERFRKLMGTPVTRGGARNVKHLWTDEERAQLATKYEELQPVWLEAKRIAKGAQRSKERTRKKEWRNEVLRAYPDLPPDLLERYANPKADDAKPGDIALIHAKRECGITEEYSPKRLREQIGAWKLKSST
jgi:hypothetical protein